MLIYVNIYIYVNVFSIWQLYEVNSVLLHFLLCPSKCPIVACRALLDLKAVTTKDQGAGDIKQLSELVLFILIPCRCFQLTLGAFDSTCLLQCVLHKLLRRLRRYGSAAEIGRNIKLIQELHYAVCFILLHGFCFNKNLFP